MSKTLGPIKYEEAEGSPFLGRDYGSKSKTFSDSIALEIDTEIRIMIESAQKEAYKIIKQNMKLLELIKTSLLENETIVSEEIEYIAKHLKLPPKKKKDKTATTTQDVDLDDLIEEVVEKESVKKTKITKIVDEEIIEE